MTPVPSGDGSGLPQPRRTRAIIAISLGTALLVTDNSIAAIALPAIAADLGIPSSTAVAVVVAYQLALLMTILPFSALGDRIGHRRLYQGGQLLFVVASAASALAPDFAMLVAGRTLQALGAAAALSVSSAMLRRIYPAARLGRGFGLNSVIIATAAALAPTIGGLLLGSGAWRPIFAAAAPFALLSLALGRSLPAPEPGIARYDLTGALICMFVFGALIGGFQLLALGVDAGIAGAVLAIGIAAGWLFVRRERGRAGPVLPVDLLSRAPIALSAAASLAAFTASLCFTLSLPFRFESLSVDRPQQLGLLMASWPVAMMVAAPVAGRLSDRAPAGLLGGMGMTLSASGFLLMALLPGDAVMTAALGPLILTGIGFGFFVSPNNHQIVRSAPANRTASAGALVSTSRLIGSTFGGALFSGLLWLKLDIASAPALAAAAFALFAASCSFSHAFFSPQRARSFRSGE